MPEGVEFTNLFVVAAVAAAMVSAGLLSVLLFPIGALVLLRGSGLASPSTPTE